AGPPLAGRLFSGPGPGRRLSDSRDGCRASLAHRPANGARGTAMAPCAQSRTVACRPARRAAGGCLVDSCLAGQSILDARLDGLAHRLLWAHHPSWSCQCAAQCALVLVAAVAARRTGCVALARLVSGAPSVA